MKLIQAVIRSSALGQVRAALTASGIGGISVYEASCCLTQDETGGDGLALNRGRTGETRRRLEIAVPDIQLAGALEALSAALPEGHKDDGEIHVVRLFQARRIRTGEINDNAL
ncbi:P-II family nitrogen regulator [Granulosicoccaceae sp. 1_MG-2023]|nr:P-II family nitrogen regulator [Granulosicoccaceae sp. 1_MG-2023]